MGASNTPENLTARYAKRPTSTNLISIDRLVVIRARKDRVADRMLTMEANLSEPLKLADMSPVSGLSRRQIERLFRREMGRSPARYYLDMRLERAHLLLITSSLPVIEIAMACGFSTASHFSRTYRERYGCTPQQTRMAKLERPREAEGRARGDERRVA